MAGMGYCAILQLYTGNKDSNANGLGVIPGSFFGS